MEQQETQYGYRRLIIWQNTKTLRRRVYEITERFPKVEMRRVSQMRDCARSSKQNIQEGYFKSTKSFINCLLISKGSINELMGDLEDCEEDGLITKEEFDELFGLAGRTDYLIKRTIDGLRRKLNPRS